MNNEMIMFIGLHFKQAKIEDNGKAKRENQCAYKVFVLYIYLVSSASETKQRRITKKINKKLRIEGCIVLF